MKDKLKRYIRDNQEAFDTETPSDELWAKLSSKLDTAFPAKTLDIKTEATVHKDYQKQGKHKPFVLINFKNWRVAASITLILGSIWIGWQLNKRYAVSEAPEIVLSNPLYARQVSQYTQLIDTKRSELNKMVATNPELSKEFAMELMQLEQSYQNLKADLPKNPNQEIVIQAMLQNLQWQIDLLNQQLQIIQKFKNSKTYENNQII